jgi:hypothetical protein
MHEPCLKAMRALFTRCQPRHDLYTLFADGMEVMALAIANSVDLRQREAREERYLAIVGRYERDVVECFAQLLGQLTLALEAGFGDVLGALFGRLELHSKARGQFFTPYTVSRMMAEATLGDGESVRALIAERGFVTAMEPACGAGSMVIALADAMHAHGINYQRHLHVTGIDIDPRAIHMAYVQLSLLHVPAQLIVGNSLSGEHREHWYTPAHILGGWNARLAARWRGEAEDQPTSTIRPPVRRPEPVGGNAAASQFSPSAATVPPPLPRQLTLF